MNLLLTSIGKRIQLIQHLKTNFRVIGADASKENPAKYFVDTFYQIPGCREDGYVSTLLDICRKEKISLLIPLFEGEFERLNEARELWEEAGVKLILSAAPVISICQDKKKTGAFFQKYRIAAPEIFSEEEVQKLITGEKAASDGSEVFPLIIKPRDGMGSEGVFCARNSRELAFFYHYVKRPIAQKCVTGTEYTIDVLCDFEGRPVYIVPRIRLEVRSGEVSKSRIDCQGRIIEETKKLLEALNREGNVTGPLTIQCFLSKDGQEIWFIEINPRFGGGVPLSFAAGADYAGALKEMCEGKKITYGKEIKELTMLRYDEAVYE